MMRSSPQHYCCCTGWDAERRTQAQPDAAMGYPVQRKCRYTETGADAGVAGFEWTNVAKCRVLETVGDSGIGEASLGGVVELALPIVGAAAGVGGVEGVPAGHLTDSATCNKSQWMDRYLIRALIIIVSSPFGESEVGRPEPSYSNRDREEVAVGREARSAQLSGREQL